MKITLSYNWLKELLPDFTLPPQELTQLLTMHSFETALLTTYQIDPQIKIVRIEAITAHPNADRLKLATVTDGHTTTQIVCGAPNIFVGATVPFSPPGSKLYDEHHQVLTVKQATIRGISSPGMINSPRELGLGQWHEGIWLLPSDLPVGSALADHWPGDAILEADILSNRAHDCLSYFGVAQEIAALLSIKVKLPPLHPWPKKKLGGWKIEVSDYHHTPRYIGTLLSGLKATTAPVWMQARLMASGTRPINLLVDITNYVMFEFGNPTHLFDAQKLPGRTMGVRWAKPTERLSTLDGVSRTLTENTLLITNQDQPVAIAGVMGGGESQISEATTTGFLEVANFNARAIQQAVSSLTLETDGAKRWTKGLDPQLAGPTTQRALKLLTDVAQAKVEGILEFYPHPLKPRSINFSPDSVSSVAGIQISASQAQEILERLGCSIKKKGKEWHVVVPTSRSDLLGSHDLVEEILRVIGLDTIPATAAVAPITAPTVVTAAEWGEMMRDVLVSAGFSEVYNYVFEDQRLASQLGFDRLDHLGLVNPIAPELKNLRVSLFPGLIKNLQRNLAEFPQQRLFELGTVFYPVSVDQPTRVPGVQEELRLTGAILGEKENFRLAKGVMESLLERLGMEDIHFNAQEVSPQDSWLAMWQAGHVAEVYVGEEEIGVIGVLSDALQHQFKLPNLVLFDLNADVVSKLATLEREFKALPKYPPVYRDISLLVKPDITVQRIQNIIERVGGEILADSELFDLYEPSPSEGIKTLQWKSVAFHLRYQASDRTLTDHEVSQIHQKIEQALQQELTAKIR